MSNLYILCEFMDLLLIDIAVWGRTPINNIIKGLCCFIIMYSAFSFIACNMFGDCAIRVLNPYPANMEYMVSS
jgi:hypothetical protein